MKNFLNVLGVLMVLVGVVWILQGINILPGSFMTGVIFYTYLGTAVAVVGAGVLAFNNLRKR